MERSIEAIERRHANAAVTIMQPAFTAQATGAIPLRYASMFSNTGATLVNATGGAKQNQTNRKTRAHIFTKFSEWFGDLC